MCRGFRPAFTLSPDNRLHPKHVLLYRCEETDAVAVAHASRWDMVSLSATTPLGTGKSVN